MISDRKVDSAASERRGGSALSSVTGRLQQVKQLLPHFLQLKSRRSGDEAAHQGWWAEPNVSRSTRNEAADDISLLLIEK